MKNLANIDIEGNLINGIFINKLNRFVAEIYINNEIHFAHVPNNILMIILM